MRLFIGQGQAKNLLTAHMLVWATVLLCSHSAQAQPPFPSGRSQYSIWDQSPPGSATPPAAPTASGSTETSGSSGQTIHSGQTIPSGQTVPSGRSVNYSEGFRPLSPVSEYYPENPGIQQSSSVMPAANTTMEPPQQPATSPRLLTESSPKEQSAAKPTQATPQVSDPRTAALPLTRPQQQTAHDEKSAKKPASAGSQLGMTVVALAVVLTLILLLAKVLKKHTPLMGNSLPSEALELLGKKMLDQRNSIHFVRIGPRILVLGASLDGLKTLAEITDPVEVDRLSGLCQPQTNESPLAQSFRLMLSGQADLAASLGLKKKNQQSSKPSPSVKNRATRTETAPLFSWETPEEDILPYRHSTADSGITPDDIAELTRTLEAARERQS